jgi:hypothetical protein
MPLEIDRIDDLAAQLAMLTANQAPDMFFAHTAQFRASLLSHHQACRPVTLSKRFAQALLTGRLVRFMHLVARQQTMLKLAANEAAETHDLYVALKDLQDAQEHYSLGPAATHKQKLGWRACHFPVLKAHYETLVRNGEVADMPEGLSLHRAKARRHVAYILFALLVAWEWLVFIAMAINGALNLAELVSYMAGAPLLSFWLTRGLFAALRTDQRAVEQVNMTLRPQKKASLRGSF